MARQPVSEGGSHAKQKCALAGQQLQLAALGMGLRAWTNTGSKILAFWNVECVAATGTARPRDRNLRSSYIT